MTAEDPAELLQELVDRQRITDTLYRYASAVDSKDYVTLRSILDDDVVGRYADRPAVQGAEAIVDWVRASTAHLGWQHHLLSVYHIDIDGDTAEAVTYHTSHQTTLEAPDDVAVIVARYRDRLRRQGKRWVITEKVMEVGWREQRAQARGGSTH